MKTIWDLDEYKYPGASTLEHQEELRAIDASSKFLSCFRYPISVCKKCWLVSSKNEKECRNCFTPYE